MNTNGHSRRFDDTLVTRGAIPVKHLLGVLVFAVLAVSGVYSKSDKPAVCLHYLGHAAFVLEFDNGISVLTDYGKSHAYGLDSPIYGLGSLKPDILTYSHQHEDHSGGTAPDGTRHVLSGNEGLDLKGLRIVPIPTYEQSLLKADNTSYLFIYRGIKILHMGDCQALITGIQEKETRKRIAEIYPDVYDLVLVPIGYVSDITGPAADFVALLQAKRLIPMHYWSPKDKEHFLAGLGKKKSGAGLAFDVDEIDGPGLCLPASGGLISSPKVISLTPAPYGEPPL